MKQLFLISLIFSLSTFAATKPFESWPTGKSPFSNSQIDELEKILFAKDKGYLTKSFLIVKDGKIVYEKSAEGFDVKTPQRLWSVSKSISSILIGIAQKQGLLNITDKVNQFYPNMDERLEISHLLHMSSGLLWNEAYENNPLDSDVLNMLFIGGHRNMASYVAGKKQEFAPGERFNYSSGETNFMMSLLQKKISRLDYDTFPWKKLFTPLGITTATWERDHTGNFIGSSYLYLSPEDLARVGQLFLNEGVWGDQEIITKDWIKYSLTRTLSQNNLPPVEQKEESYGAHWWLNTKINGVGKKHPNAPEDIYMALGHHGQSMIVVPEENIIFVRTAIDKDGVFDRNLIFKALFNERYLEK